MLDEEDACTPPKKKHKKEHKHKHKKHSGEKTKKHKKHKKHKHKHSNVEEEEQQHRSPVANSTNERFTPELTPKRDKKGVINGQVVTNDKVTTETKPVKTDADEIVKFVSRGLSSTHILEVISSESEAEQEAECDSDAIDVNVIEADMDLEELMKQKELLQAEIAKAELDATPSPVVVISGDGRRNGNKVAKVEDEVILLDDSSEGEIEVRQKRKKSKSRERRVVISGKEFVSRNEVKRYRSRSKERNYREFEKYKHDRGHNKEMNR